MGLVFAFLLIWSLFGGVSVLGASVAPPEEDVWVKLAPMQQARCELGAAVVDGKIYAMDGTVITHLDPWHSESKVVDTVEMYDPVTNKWVYQTPMPVPSSNFAVAVFENKIYCIGGGVLWVYNAASHGMDPLFREGFNLVYDPVLAVWEYRAAMPVSREGSQAHVVGGKIYLLGGGFSEWFLELDL